MTKQLFVKIITIMGIFVVSCLTGVSTAFAEQKSITLTYDYTDTVDNFRAYERLAAGKEMLGEVTGDLRSITFIRDIDTSTCHTFFIAPVLSGIESYPSNGITWCPDSTLPPFIQRPKTVDGVNIIIETH